MDGFFYVRCAEVVGNNRPPPVAHTLKILTCCGSHATSRLYKNYATHSALLTKTQTHSHFKMESLRGNTNGQGLYWVFTINNPTDDDKTGLESLVSESGFINFVRFTLEHSTGEGTPHYQGHLECSKRVRRSQLSRLLPRAFLAIRKGTFEQCEEYCLKEEDAETHSFGARVSKGAGKRTDLDELADRIRSGDTKRELAETYGKEFIKYRRGIDEYINMFEKRSFQIFHGPFRWGHSISGSKSQIFWGAAGVGKTEYAKYLLPNSLFVTHLDDLGSFNDTYDGIIFDDMSFGHLPRTSQIHLVDMDNDRSIHIRYKTAMIPKGTPKIFLTNVRNGEIFDLEDAAVARRVEVYHLE